MRQYRAAKNCCGSSRNPTPDHREQQRCGCSPNGATIMRGKRVTFPGMVVPALLLAPQLAITFVFFVWPSIQSLRSSLFRQDAFGTSEEFVGLANFIKLFADPDY